MDLSVACAVGLEASQSQVGPGVQLSTRPCLKTSRGAAIGMDTPTRSAGIGLVVVIWDGPSIVKLGVLVLALLLLFAPVSL